MIENPYNYGWQHEIYRLLECYSGNADCVIMAAQQRVGERPLIFKRHNPIPGQPKVEVSLSEQQEIFRGHVRRLAKRHRNDFTTQGNSEPQSEPEPAPEPVTTNPIQWPDSVPVIEPESEPAPIVITSGADTIRARFREYGATIEGLRVFSNSRKLTSLESMRLNIDGRKLIARGLPVDGLLANVCSHMGEDTARQAGIRSAFDWAAWGRMYGAGEDEHGATPAISAAIAANVPVWIWGGAGIGKSYGAAKFASQNGFDFYELNLSAQGPGALTGRDRLHEFVQSNFTTAYRDGGVWDGEEIDNADARVLTLINNAVANGHFSNPVTGETIQRHPDFRIVVTANTNGTGAANGFIRNKIDRASVDRFAVGMFNLQRDDRLERHIMAGLETDLLAEIEAGSIQPIGF
jgi:hypothetical protein